MSPAGNEKLRWQEIKRWKIVALAAAVSAAVGSVFLPVGLAVSVAALALLLAIAQMAVWHAESHPTIAWMRWSS